MELNILIQAFTLTIAIISSINFVCWTNYRFTFSPKSILNSLVSLLICFVCLAIEIKYMVLVPKGALLLEFIIFSIIYLTYSFLSREDK